MDENEQCVMCHQYNDQMLMLTCVHDPCINCAANYYLEEAKGKPNYYFYTCRVCNAKTPLDVTSVIQLEKLGKSSKKQRDLPTPSQATLPMRTEVKKRTTMATQNDRDLYPISSKRAQQSKASKHEHFDDVDLLKDLPKPRSNSFTKRIKMCKEHSDEQISYYCFKCLENICPECAIHGSHQGHQVKSVKKAIGDIRKQFMELVDKGQKTQAIHKRSKEGHVKTIRDLADQTSRQKAFIAKEFQMLRGSLLTKEKQIMKELDELQQRNVSLLNTEVQIVQKEHDMAGQFIRSVENILSKDEITILEQFGKKNDVFSREIEKIAYSGNSKVAGLKSANINDIKQFINRVVDEFSEFRIDFTDMQASQRDHLRDYP